MAGKTCRSGQERNTLGFPSEDIRGPDDLVRPGRVRDLSHGFHTENPGAVPLLNHLQALPRRRRPHPDGLIMTCRDDPDLKIERKSGPVVEIEIELGLALASSLPHWW